jgi:hypothetical protein
LQGITRVSFGIQNTEEEVDAMIGEIKRIAGVSGNRSVSTEVRIHENRNVAPEKHVKQQIKDFIRKERVWFTVKIVLLFPH